MSLHSVEFASAVSLFFVLLAVTGAASWRRARWRNREPSLDELLTRLLTVSRENVAHVATDGGQAGLDSWQIWELVGGLEGLQTLAGNCDVLIALASHVQRWYPEALPVAEQLRLNAREIQWHVERLQGAEVRGNLEAVFPDYAQRAVAIYYDMTQHVRTLYEGTQVPGWAQLRSVL